MYRTLTCPKVSCRPCKTTIHKASCLRLNVLIRTDVWLWLVRCCTLYLLAHSVNCLTSVNSDLVGMAAKASYAMVRCQSQRPSSVLCGLYVVLANTLMLGEALPAVNADILKWLDALLHGANGACGCCLQVMQSIWSAGLKTVFSCRCTSSETPLRRMLQQ